MDGLLSELKTLVEQRKSFEDHAGRKGKVGGSLPKGQQNAPDAKKPRRDPWDDPRHDKQGEEHLASDDFWTSRFPEAPISQNEDAEPIGGGLLKTDNYAAMAEALQTDIYREAKSSMKSSIRTRPGDTPEDYIQAAVNNLQNLIDSNPVSIRGSEIMADKLLTEGRFKTQFESGKSGGLFDPYMRKRIEDFSGTPFDTANEERPVYGYLDTGKFVDKKCSQYGNCEFVLKDSVKDRTSVCVGDSLDRRGWILPTPARQAGAVGMGPRYLEVFNYGQNLDGIPDYIETQIHGGVKLEDVEKVIYHHPLLGKSKDVDGYLDVLKEKFAKVGISVEPYKKLRKPKKAGA